MANKNRVVRVSDALWADVERVASSLGLPISQFVRNALGRAVTRRNCFVCGSPATGEVIAPLGANKDQSLEEFMSLIAAGQDPERGVRSVPTLVAYACEAHHDGACDYLLDNDYSVGGYRIAGQHQQASFREPTSETDPAYLAMGEVFNAIKA